MKPKEQLQTEPTAEFPEELDYLWGWFLEIIGGISVSGFAPAQVTWGDIVDWATLTWVDPEPWEARALVLVSSLRASIQAEKSRDRDKSKDRGKKGASK